MMCQTEFTQNRLLMHYWRQFPKPGYIIDIRIYYYLNTWASRVHSM
jgi:hypothetical protein